MYIYFNEFINTYHLNYKNMIIKVYDDEKVHRKQEFTPIFQSHSFK